MARNRIIYGSQSVWCNGEILYRVQTLGSTTTFTSADIFELGHLDIIDVVDDVPAVAVTVNTNAWGDVKTMAILAQVKPAKLAMIATAADNNANLVVVSGSALTETATYLHGVCLADFAIVCGNLAGITLWAPVQSECDLGTLATDIDQTLFMDEVFMNRLEMGFTTGANATENYAGETDQKMWLLNAGKFVNWEEIAYTTITGAGGIPIASGVTIATMSDNTYAFLRSDANGARAVTWYDADQDEMINVAVVSGTVATTTTFVYNEITKKLLKPTGTSYASGDKLFVVYAADGYTTTPTNNVYFTELDSTYRPDTIGAIRQGQVEIYIVGNNDVSYANAWRLTGCTITSDMTRTPLAELGHLGPYDRPMTMPVPITITIDTTAGDLEHWARFANRYASYAADTMVEIDLADLMASDDMSLIVKVFAQTDEEANGTAASRKLAVGSDLIGQQYFNDGTAANYAAANEREYALKTIIVEHLKMTNEAYTLNMGANATQTFSFRSTNDLYVVKGDVSIANITGAFRVRRNG
jgi:hypothetical protein